MPPPKAWGGGDIYLLFRAGMQNRHMVLLGKYMAGALVPMAIALVNHFAI